MALPPNMMQMQMQKRAMPQGGQVPKAKLPGQPSQMPGKVPMQMPQAPQSVPNAPQMQQSGGVPRSGGAPAYQKAVPMGMQMQQAAPNFKQAGGGQMPVFSSAAVQSALANYKGNQKSGAAPGAPAQDNNVMGDIDKMYQDLLGEDAKAWEDQQGKLQGQMAGFGREADILNARIGGGTIDGGYAALSGAALGKGMDAYNDAAQQHGDRRRNLMLSWMDKQIGEKRRLQEKQWSDDAWNRQRAADLEDLANQRQWDLDNSPQAQMAKLEQNDARADNNNQFQANLKALDNPVTERQMFGTNYELDAYKKNQFKTWATRFYNENGRYPSKQEMMIELDELAGYNREARK